VTKVYLTGGASRSAFLKEMLAEKIGVDVEIFDPFEGLTVDEKAVDPSVVAQLNTSATVSVGSRCGTWRLADDPDQPGPWEAEEAQGAERRSAWIALPLVVLAGTIYFHTTVSGKISRLDADIVKANATSSG